MALPGETASQPTGSAPRNVQDRTPISMVDAARRVLVRSKFNTDDLRWHSDSTLADKQAAHHIPQSIASVGHEGPDGSAR